MTLDYDELDPFAYERRHEASPREEYMHAHWGPRYRAAFREAAHGRVLELGCGAGMYTRELLAADVVIAIDLSKRFLERAKANIDGVSFARVDAHTLPFADLSFDAVVSIGIFEYLDRPRAFAEIARVLRHGGPLVFAVPNRHSPFRAMARLVQRIARVAPTCEEPTFRELHALCDEHGLAIESIERSDRLIWLPDAVDRLIGGSLYKALERLPTDRMSSISLVRARRR